MNCHRFHGRAPKRLVEFSKQRVALANGLKEPLNRLTLGDLGLPSGGCVGQLAFYSVISAGKLFVAGEVILLIAGLGGRRGKKIVHLRVNPGKSLL